MVQFKRKQKRAYPIRWDTVRRRYQLFLRDIPAERRRRKAGYLRRKLRREKRINDLEDSYCITLLKYHVFEHDDITQDLIQLKRKQVCLKRKLKQLTT